MIHATAPFLHAETLLSRYSCPRDNPIARPPGHQLHGEIYAGYRTLITKSKAGADKRGPQPTFMRLDIPGASVSSGEGVLAVGPGGGFVVEGSGFKAAVQDADETVGEPPQGVVVTVSGGSLLVVEGAGAG
jgi:hypothetical protein